MIRMISYSPQGDVVHQVEYMLQIGQYKGSFILEIQGNIKGLGIFYTDIFEWLTNEQLEALKSNDCLLKYDETENVYSFVLSNNGGEAKKFTNFTVEDIEGIVVGIEIKGYYINDNEFGNVDR